MSDIHALHKNLIFEWQKDKKNTKALKAILQKIENELIKPEIINSLTPVTSSSIHKDFYEITALYYLLVNDLTRFEESITKVTCFYASQKFDSPNKYLIIGAYLMHLLSSNRFSEFHTILEQIDQSIQQENVYIKTPVELEQFLVEGAYNKIMLNRRTLPSPFYLDFVQLLISSIRNDVAACLEKSYKKLQFKDARTMLLFDDESEVIKFGKLRGWKSNNREFQFDTISEQESSLNLIKQNQLDTQRIIKKNLYYAKQLEMII